MAKKKKEQTEKTTRTVVIHKPNGAEAKTIAPEPGTKEPLRVSPAEALDLLIALTAVNDDALEAHRKYVDLKERTKTAKERWDALAEEVQAMIQRAAHGSADLPLFDAGQAEADRAAMVSAENPGEDAPGEAIKPKADLEPTSDDVPF